MPRVACLDSQTKKERQVHALIEHYLIVRNKSDNDLAKYLNLHVTTFRKKKRKPSTFTLLEIQRVVSYLKFEERDKVACL